MLAFLKVDAANGKVLFMLVGGIHLKLRSQAERGTYHYKAQAGFARRQR